ncbi:MAG: hypothetical protein Q9191_006811 [Dirinaria sp. TL-2023a]
MRLALRLALGSSLVILIPFFLLIRHLLDLGNQYNVTAYIQSSFRSGAHDKVPPIPAKAGDKIIIMAKLEAEDTDWVGEYLPDWQHAIYTVNPSSSSTSSTTTNKPKTLTTPLNKGHESMAYLSYIIDNYASLPSTLAFIHSHASGFLTAWHTDTPLHSNIAALSTLRIAFVQENGYVNLRCNWNPGCVPAHRVNKHVTPQVWGEVFANVSAPLLLQRKGEEEGREVPEQVAAACCAQFAVSRDRVLKRPRSDYVALRKWVVETGKSDAQSGRVMEFLWHVVFGMGPV